MRQFSRYLMVGAVNTLLGYFVIFSCMYLFELSPEASNVVGYSIGLIFSYVLNRNYTFNSKQGRKAEIIRFLFVFCLAYVSNYGILVLLIHALEVHAVIAQITAGIGYVIISYFLNKYYVFNLCRQVEGMLDK